MSPPFLPWLNVQRSTFNVQRSAPALWLLFLLLLSSPTARAQTAPEITGVLWITNTPAGLTTNITVNAGTADTRWWTNNASATNSILIQTTNTIGWSRSNLVAHFSAAPVYTVGLGSPSVFVWLNPTNTACVNFTAPDNTNLTLTAAGTWARVAYYTNFYATSVPIQNRTNAMSHRERTNAVNALINFLSSMASAIPTNHLPNGLPGFTNLLDQTSYQTSSHKTFTAPTNNGGLSDGTRGTNYTAISGSNITFAVFIFQGDGHVSGLTNLAGNMGAGALTNGSFYSNVLNYVRGTNLQALHGTVHILSNGTWVAGTFTNPTTLNLINYGNAIRSEGPGGNSFQAGSNTFVYGANSAAIGNGSTISNNNVFAGGNNITGYAPNSVFLGPNSGGLVTPWSVTSGGYLNVIGANSRATGATVNLIAANSWVSGGGLNSLMGYDLYLTDWEDSVLISSDVVSSGITNFVGIGNNLGGFANNALGLGSRAAASNKNSFALGPVDTGGNPVFTTTTNQGVIGTELYRIHVPGVFHAAGTSNLYTLPDTFNTIDGSLAFPPYPYTGVNNAGAHNLLYIGTNVVTTISGTPTAHGWPVGGIDDGWDGRWVMIQNATSYEGTIWHHDASIAAGYQIHTLTGTNTSWPAGAWAFFLYSEGTGYWMLQQPPLTILTASATNAVDRGENLGTTNATRMGVFYQVQGMTNIQFRAVQAGNGIVKTNEGTNIVTAIDPAVVASQANLTTASNVVRDAALAALTNKVDKLNGVATNLTVSASGAASALTVRALAGNTTDTMQWQTTNGGVQGLVRTNGTLVFTNYAQTPPELVGASGGNEVGVAYRLFSLTNSVTVTNTTSATSLITNALWGSQVIKANTLKPGMTVRLRAGGLLTSASSTACEVGIRFSNGTTIATNMAALATSLVNDVFFVECDIAVRDVGASGSVLGLGGFSYTSASGSANSAAPRRMQNGLLQSTTTVDTTTDQVLDLYVDPGATTHGFTLNRCTVEIIP